MMPRLSDGADIDLDEHPLLKAMLEEQRKLAQIGGKPCEWDEEQWAIWNAHDDLPEES